MFSGDRQSVDAETAKKMAVALNVSIEWLLEGRGPAPVPTGPVPSRYEEHGLQSADLDRWVKAATTDAGELDASRLTETNNFEAAARSVQDSIGKRVVNNVRKRHRDQYPNGFSQIRWFIEFGREKERLAQMAKAKGAKGSGAKSDDETKAG